MDTLTDEQAAALQAVANVCHEGQVASIDSLVRSVRDHGNCRALDDLDLSDFGLRVRLDELYIALSELYLVVRVERKMVLHVRLTQDGYRHPQITVL